MAADAAGRRKAPPTALIVFGASGDLTSRKLMPGLASAAERGSLVDGFAVVGVARTEMDDEDFRQRVLEATPDAGPAWRDMVAGFRYVAGDYAHDDTFDALAKVLDELDASRGTSCNRVHYMATVPSVVPPVVEAMGRHGMNRPKSEDGFVRIVIEKPFGRDLSSARQLDQQVHAVFAEEQVYRIDHYLGKETVQNVLALRFANAIFEPIWNRRYVDSVQITVAEELGVGHRGGFYETAGALRDIVQNHLLQVLAITAMEPPATIDPQGIRDEKVKLLRAVDILTPDKVGNEVIRGQYVAGTVDGKEVVGYHDEEDVARDSRTETFMAAKLQIDNWRWAGVPFYIRTGKRLPHRVTEVAMEFKGVPHLPFASSETTGLHPNALSVRIQPDEGITLRFGAKVPGQAFTVRDVTMDFSYRESFAEEPPDAYERLLLDAMTGDPTLFIRSDEVEQAWRIVEPVLEAWQSPDVTLATYPAGTWGPPEADHLLERDGRRWREP
ncbi:MAG: glucose-6-phosphate 1-dehydrogenase [Actinomycetota bacterium]|nr:glucose-6-phosphate 1-dehydrogenase [Actinomycetota bacterium]